MGLTAGLAAPLIASGVGATLGMLNLAGGTFLGSTGGIALITSSSAVAGGSKIFYF